MSDAPKALPRTLWIALGAALLLAIGQQQLLERRPPRLLQLQPQPFSSGPGALELRFSRPMRRSSLAVASRLTPPLAHRWQGSEDVLRLLLMPDQRLLQPLALDLAGADRRGQALPAQRWWWDPRPYRLVVAQVSGGEQVQLISHEGRPLPLSPVWHRIPTLEPLADGRGVVFLASDSSGHQELWLRRLKPRTLARRRQELGPPRPGELRRLVAGPLGYAHLSSNSLGDLLVQTAAPVPGGERTLMMDRRGRPRRLGLQVSGPIRLLPGGEGMVVPVPEGLELQSLDGDAQDAPILPGNRQVSAFCPATGRGLLVRHWPDYRRSLEQLQPGSAPRTVWIGSEGLMAAACDQTGDRLWMLLNRWRGTPENEIVRLDASGRILGRRDLGDWRPEAGTGLSHDPVGDRLLLSVRRDPREAARPALLDGRSLELRILPEPVSQAVWLPPG